MFLNMKQEVEPAVQQWGSENAPPPAQLFTIKPNPGDGNVHLVQKVFRGSFEVRHYRSHTVDKQLTDLV